jgi:hypothetical protein
MSVYSAHYVITRFVLRNLVPTYTYNITAGSSNIGWQTYNASLALPVPSNQGWDVLVAVYRWQCQPRGSVQVAASESAKGQCTGGSVQVAVYRWQPRDSVQVSSKCQCHPSVSVQVLAKEQCTGGSGSFCIRYTNTSIQYSFLG